MPIARTRELPFVWGEFFVSSKTECLLACYAMSARYWKSFFPELNLPTDLEVWKKFADKSFLEYRGTSIHDMMRKAPIAIPLETEATLPEDVGEKETIGPKPTEAHPTQFLDLVVKINALNGLESVVPFFQTRPPLPQVLVFDQLLMTHNIRGNYHAVILHSVDFEKEKLFVIDPTKLHLLEPDVYDFRLFQKAWRECQNLQIVTYPKGMITIISGPSVGIVHQTEITEFAEGSK